MRRELLLNDNQLNEMKNKFYAILAEMGIGKTHSIKTVALPWAFEKSMRILILTHRTTLKVQTENETQELREKYHSLFRGNTVEIVNYQKIVHDYMNDKKEEWLNKYDMVFFDEAHCIVTDSWNGSTDYIVQFLEEINVPRVLVTGTPKYLMPLIEKWKAEILRTIDVTNTDIEQIRFYQKQETFIKELKISVSDSCKVLAFVNGSSNRILDLSTKLGASFICSKSNILYPFADKEIISEIENNGVNLSTNLICATAVWNEGINIKDPQFKAVASFFPRRVDDVYQQFARARESNIAGCVLVPTNQMLSGIMMKNNEELEKNDLSFTRRIFLNEHNKEIREILSCNGGFKEYFMRRYPTIQCIDVDEINYDNKICDFLDSLVGTKLFKEEDLSQISNTDLNKITIKNMTQEEFIETMIEEFRIRGNQGQKNIKMTVIKKWLDEKNYNYKLEPNRDRSRKSPTYGKSFWIIEKLIDKD